ncbi:hypothetical protein [Thalassotalea maritima]|uniref:hypothetical protein n=1 Tax=Thalassotalea maritima TaxID=3242416 RepID=UPI0035287A79
MSDNTNKDNRSGDSANVNGGVASRRAFIKKASVAVPLITTMAAKPVWGSEYYGKRGGCSISGQVSGHNSGPETISTECKEISYSPSSWLGGKACGIGSSYGNVWGYLDFSLDTSISTLLSTNSKILIGKALADNTNISRQVSVAAALNAHLWEKTLAICNQDASSCDMLKVIEPGFFFPYSVAYIQSRYSYGPDKTTLTAWQTAQIID